MITIRANKKFKAEKEYIINFIFRIQLGVEYQLIFDDEQNYRIFFNHSNSLIINDAFFNKFEDNQPYYTDKSNIPVEITRFDYPEIEIFDLPIIYGDASYSKNESEVYFGIDIIAGSFFMLSRWEEIAHNTRDIHNRFTETENLSVKHNFYKRPIVNEYIDIIRNEITKADLNIKLKENKPKIFLTTDVDFTGKYDSLRKISKSILGDIFKRNSFSYLSTTIKESLKTMLKKDYNAFNNYDYLMDLSEKVNTKSRFYFIPGKLGEEDVHYNIDNAKTSKIIKNIIDRGHILGIHPSYSAFNNEDQLKIELERLKKYNYNINEGRQHFLRFKVPDTWQRWENLELKYDSSLGFHNRCGFRAGVCNEYPVFNLISRKEIKLCERPLILMDTALKNESTDKSNALNIASELIKTTFKHNGDFVLLWHNNSLNINEWKGWEKVYEKIIDEIANIYKS